MPLRADTPAAQDVAAVDVTTTADDGHDDCRLDDTGSLADGEGQSDDGIASLKTKRKINFSRLLGYIVLPCLALLLAVAAGFLKWQDSSIRDSRVAGIESVAAARDGAIAILSYQADTVEKDLAAARERLTGTFKESYTQLTNDVVIPGSRQQHISAVATVPATASVSVTGSHAVALVFVNQTVTVGKDASSAAASSVRVTLDKVENHWLISGFDPV